MRVNKNAVYKLINHALKSTINSEVNDMSKTITANELKVNGVSLLEKITDEQDETKICCAYY